METRAAVCEYDAKRDHLTLTVGSQGSHRLRDILCQNVLNIPTDKMRVICPDVGGGFGTKLFPYREYVLMAVAARKLKKTVKWTADRSDHFMGDAQGRDNVTVAKMALAEDGKFLEDGRRSDRRHGRVSVDLRPLHPAWRRRHVAGALRFPGLPLPGVRTVFTNTVPVNAYRGAGRPEAAYVIERLVDAAARKLGVTPEIRRKTFIAPKAMPYTTATGKVYIYFLGDFTAHMRKRAMEIANWKEFQKRAKAAKKQGLVRGIGLASYVEVCGTMGDETANVALDPNGDVSILIGTQSSGQGHRPPMRSSSPSSSACRPSVCIFCRAIPRRLPANGLGTGGSASIPTGGVCVQRATHDLGNKLKEIAAQALEAGIGDLEIGNGTVRVAGTDRSVSFADLAKRPGTDPSKLNASSTFRLGRRHLSERHPSRRSRDRSGATGIIKIVNYVIVDDFGVTLNPLLLAGQVHGGAMQGIGQALMEQAVYSDTDGQLVTGTFMDYALPRAEDGPSFRVRNPQRALQDQSAWREGGGRGGRDRLMPGGGQRHRRGAVAGIQNRPHRHAGHRRKGLDRHAGGTAELKELWPT